MFSAESTIGSAPMNRSVWLLAAGSAALAGPLAAPQQTRPPNVVVIVADDMGYADIGSYGSKDIPTPHLDGLARRGIRFTDAYVSMPYCSPTRAGLLTGRYPQRFGHEYNIGIADEHRDAGLPVDQVTIADRLRAAGYRTAVFGKWHLGFAPRFFPTRRGFDEFFGFLAGAHSYVAPQRVANPIYDGDRIVTAIPYLTDTLAARAVEYIHRNRGRPFFLYLPFNAVHTPLQATPQYRARVAPIADSTRQTYAAMLVAMDDAIGKVLGAIHDAELDRNTLVFFFSDNGGPLDPAWNGASNAPLRGDKGTTWEGGIRVPFLIAWEGRLPAGTVETRPIIQLDVLPTALAAAGVAIPKDSLDGVNLLPFLTGANAAAPHEALYWRSGRRMAIREGDWKLVRSDTRAPEDTAGMTLAGAALYDVRADPGEAHDLAARDPERVRALGARWWSWSRTLAAPAWRPPGSFLSAQRACAAGVPVYSGTWQGEVTAAGPFAWVQRVDGTGAFRIGADTAIATRTVSQSDDSLVVELTGPIRGPPPQREPLTVRLATTVCGDTARGILWARSPGGAVMRLPFAATRAGPP